mmetsp:Transcript_12824/g.25963  ORF Transcript_12824/g.25963 Transcript_12824/m.25963 type:complete len:594 (-) Transcript_12824:112-1893(-)
MSKQSSAGCRCKQIEMIVDNPTVASCIDGTDDDDLHDTFLEEKNDELQGMLAHVDGPKRTNSLGDLRKKKRPCCKQFPNKCGNINAEIIKELDPNISLEEANAILHDYNHTLKILKCQTNDATPSVEYMIQLINDWKPKTEIICMYVRWSKRLRRNFHLDSISTLLCVANQCDYTPHVFLKNVKTLTISSSTTTYGLNFKFDTCKNKAIDGTKLNERFLGLSITLRLLQSGIVSGSGTLGNVGLKTSPKAKQSNEDVYLTTGLRNTSQKYVVAHKPTTRFHTNGGLLGRIWLAIQHRWISIQVVEMLFPAQLALAETEQESLAFSFQMHSSAGPTRYDFLDPLIGVCLRFRTTAIIDNHTNIRGNIWNKPSSFVAFGNGYLQATSEKDRIQYVAETFKHLKSMMTNWKKITIHPKTEREVKWQMVRGYAFHSWLDRVKNQQLKVAVDSSVSIATSPMNSLKQKKSTTKMPATNRRIEINTSTRSSPSFDPVIGVANKNKLSSSGGLAPLLTTRQVSAPPSVMQPPIAQPKPQPQQESQGEQSHSTTAGTIKPTKSVDPTSFVWSCIRLASKLEISSRVSSHFVLHREDGIDLQ